jgi:hypothetical protein
MNGFSDKTMQNPGKIEKIELILEDLDKMNVFCVFKNLKSLTLINVGLSVIEVFTIINFLSDFPL